MVAEKFTFCWDEYDNNVPQTFKQLWQNEDFADVTLATKDDAQIRAHKVIISASSPVFQNILLKNLHSNPLIYFHNIKSVDLKLLLRFIYQGQCEVSQNGLVDFLAAGKELMVKGLVEEEVNIEWDPVKQNSQNEPISPKAELFNSDTKLEDEGANDVSSTFEMDETESNIDPIGPEIDQYSDTKDMHEVLFKVKRKSRDPAPVWEAGGKKTNSGSVCTLCGKTYKSGNSTSMLTSHIVIKHRKTPQGKKLKELAEAKKSKALIKKA